MILLISGIYVFVKNNIISILFLKIKVKDTKNNTHLRTINKRCDFLILILWTFFSFLIVLYLIAFSANNGAGGYNTTEWRESDLMSSIEEMEFEGKVYSNSPDAIYAILEMKNIELMPRETWYSSTKTANDLIGVKENVMKGHNVTLIWFNNHLKDYLISLDQIKDIFNITVLISTNDGQILKIENIKAD